MMFSTEALGNRETPDGDDDRLWREVLRSVAAAPDEGTGDRIGKGPLTTLLARGPEWEAVVAQEARHNPRLACALAYSSAGPRIASLLGPQPVVAAFVRFSQRHVPGWWDGWSVSAIEGALDERPADGWAMLVSIAEAAPNDEVLTQLINSFLLDILERRLDVFGGWLLADLPTLPKLRQAARMALKDVASRGVPESPLLDAIRGAAYGHEIGEATDPLQHDIR